MSFGGKIRIAGYVLCALASLRSFAQSSYYDEQPRWHLTGNAGFSYSNATQQPLPSGDPGSYKDILGDLRLLGDGYLLDPRFLHLNLGFNLAQGVTQSSIGSSGNAGKAFAVSVGFLPRSSHPLRVTWTRSDFGNDGFGLKQNNTDSRLDIQWNLIKPNLPRLTVNYQRYANVVNVPESFGDQSYNGNGLNFGASDTWKGWDWSGNFALGSSGSTAVGGLTLASAFDEKYKAANFTVSRSFWERRARLQFENREDWRDDHLAGDGTTNTAEGYTTANFDWQVTNKLSTRAGFAHTSLSFDNTVGAVPGVPTTFVGLNSFSSNALSGRVEYKLLPWLRVYEDLRYTRSAPMAETQDSETGLTEMISGATAAYRWRGFDLNGSFALDSQSTSTHFGDANHSFSPQFDARVSWGSVRRVRLTGLISHSRRNLVEQIGGFSQIDRQRVEVETSALHGFRLRGGIEKSTVELLNVSGDTATHQTNFDVSLDARRFTVTAFRTLSDGAGALFPSVIQPPGLLIFPLPIDQLIASPLLDRTTRATGAAAIFRLKRNLELNGNYRVEHTLIPTAAEDFRVIEVRGRYRLGKFTAEGGIGKYKNLSTNTSLLTGTDFTRYYIRIGRDFVIF